MAFVPIKFIFNNIAFGLASSDESKVIQAARDADVYQNIMGMSMKNKVNS